LQKVKKGEKGDGSYARHTQFIVDRGYKQPAIYPHL